MKSEARIATPSASRYLQQVCKHWSHKFKVEFTPEAGEILFPDGRVCRLDASPTELICTAEAANAETLERFERVIVEHVKRFAFRENLDNVAWTQRPD
jgi:uncharacterized protein